MLLAGGSGLKNAFRFGMAFAATFSFIGIGAGLFAPLGAQNTVMMPGAGPGDAGQMQAYQLMQQAINKLQSKDARGAQPLLEQAARQWPGMPHLHYYLGFCYNDQGQYARAIPEFEQAIQADPQRVECMTNLATCYQLNGQPAEAANWFERYLQQKPNSPKAAQVKSLIPALKKLAATKAPARNAADYFSSVQIGGKHRRWSARRQPLRIFIANGTNERQEMVAGFSPAYNYILADAIKAWIAASGGKLSNVYVTSPEQADIICTWTDNPAFHAAGGQVEQGTTLRQEQELPDGSVEINRAFVTILVNSRDTGVPLPNTQMARACLHEIGHALGLAGHSILAEDIMFYSELPSGQAVLSPRDQRTFAKLYQDHPALNSNARGI